MSQASRTVGAGTLDMARAHSGHKHNLAAVGRLAHDESPKHPETTRASRIVHDRRARRHMATKVNHLRSAVVSAPNRSARVGQAPKRCPRTTMDRSAGASPAAGYMQHGAGDTVSQIGG